jgi:hypothetical protein
MLLPGIETGSIRLDFRLGCWILACQVKQSLSLHSVACNCGDRGKDVESCFFLEDFPFGWNLGTEVKMKVNERTL